MKAVLFILLAALMALVSIGCSNSPVSVSPVSGEAVAKVTINLEKIGVLGKVAASNKTPTMVLLWGRVPDTYDTVFVSGSNSVVSYINGFYRGQSYTLFANTLNSDGVELHFGGPVDFTVANVDTFTVNMSLDASQQQMVVNVPIKGTVVEARACSVMTIVQSTTDNVCSRPDTSVVKFTEGSIDTAKFDKLIPISNASAQTAYKVWVVIFLNDDSYYQGIGTVNLESSVNASMTIQLTKYGGASSLSKMTITIGVIGTLSVDVEFL